LYASEAKNKNQQKIPKEVQKTVVFFERNKVKPTDPAHQKIFCSACSLPGKNFYKLLDFKLKVGTLNQS